MFATPLHILMIEDNPGDVRLLREMLREKRGPNCDLSVAERLSQGLDKLAEKSFDIVLLDLLLPDSSGLDTFIATYAQAPHLPIIVLTGLDDEELANNAVRYGAQDYLVKGEIDSNVLFRSIRYAIDRKKAEEQLRRHHDHLEELVKERTAELIQSNQQLQREIAERKRIEEALRQSEKNLQMLSFKLITAQEDERKRIAQELHDSIGQILSAVKFGVENALSLLKNGNPLTYATPLESLVPIIQNAIEEVREICTDLWPSMLDDLGIVATISWFCREYQMIYGGIRIEKNIQVQKHEIPDYLKIVIYRLMQEAFNNTAKHSKANRVKLALGKKNGAIHLLIEDNGVGFDVDKIICGDISKRGLGLSSMKKRTEHSGGSFSIRSELGQGTAIHAFWRVHQ